MSYIRTSDERYAPGLFPLPTPQSLELNGVRGGGLPLAAGQYEFAYSFVAEDGRLTEKGPSSFMQLKQNSNYGVRFGHDQLVRAVGIILWSRRIDGIPGVTAHAIEYDWRPAGAQLDCNNAQSTPKPYLPMVGWLNHLLAAHEIHRCVRLVSGQGWDRYEDLPRSPESPPLYAPTILPYFVPAVSLDVRIRLVGSHGVSLPSEPVTIGVNTEGEYHLPFELCKRERPQQGCKGYYIEAKKTATRDTWYRQKNPAQCGMLWPFAMTHFEIKNYTEDHPVTETIEPGETWLASIQRILSETNADVIVDQDQVIFSPVFNGHENAAVGDAYGRTIRGEHGLPWKLIHANDSELHTALAPHAFAGWVESSIDTVLDGLRINSKSFDVGIDYCAYDDSSAFRPLVSNYNITLSGSGYRVGIRQMREARAPVPRGATVYNKDSRTCSEPKHLRGVIRATYGFVVEGGQSANWVFDDTHFSGSAMNDSAFGSINNNGHVTISGQNVIERGRAILALVSARLVRLSNLFSDKGFPSWFCISNRCAPVIEVDCAVPNQQKTAWLHLVEHACSGQGMAELYMMGRMDAQAVDLGNMVVPMDASVFTTRYAGVRYLIDPHCRFGTFTLNQPTLEQWDTAMADFVNARSYKKTWDGDVDIAQVVQPALSYGVGVSVGVGLGS